MLVYSSTVLTMTIMIMMMMRKLFFPAFPLLQSRSVSMFFLSIHFSSAFFPLFHSFLSSIYFVTCLQSLSQHILKYLMLLSTLSNRKIFKFVMLYGLCIGSLNQKRAKVELLRHITSNIINGA